MCYHLGLPDRYLDKPHLARHVGGRSMKASESSETSGTVMVALMANGAIAVLKFLMAFVSGSAAMLAEGFHSLADTGNQLFLLLGIHSSRRPPDERHPFGYGKDIFFWAFVVAISMFTMGSVIALYEGFQKFLEPHHISDRHLLYSGAVLVSAILFESFAFYKALKQLRKEWTDGSFWAHVKKTKNSALLTVFFEDLAALVGLVVALAGLAITWLSAQPVWDGVSSIVIGLLLAYVAFFLARESRALLLGERASDHLLAFVRDRLYEREEIEDFETIRSMHVGPSSVLITTRVKLRPSLTLDEIDRITDAVQKEIQEKYPMVRHIYLEAMD